jgi:hypothetical protein
MPTPRSPRPRRPSPGRGRGAPPASGRGMHTRVRRLLGREGGWAIRPACEDRPAGSSGQPPSTCASALVRGTPPCPAPSGLRNHSRRRASEGLVPVQSSAEVDQRDDRRSPDSMIVAVERGTTRPLTGPAAARRQYGSPTTPRPRTARAVEPPATPHRTQLAEASAASRPPPGLVRRRRAGTYEVGHRPGRALMAGLEPGAISILHGAPVPAREHRGPPRGRRRDREPTGDRRPRTLAGRRVLISWSRSATT